MWRLQACTFIGLLGIISVLAAKASAEPAPPTPAGTPSITIDVPRKDPSGIPIGVVRATVSFASNASVILNISDPGKSSGWQIDLPSGSPSNCSGTLLAISGGFGCRFPQPATVVSCPTVCQDEIVITNDPTAEAGSSRYQITFTLKSNFITSGPPSCPDPDTNTSTQDSFRISVTAGGPNITGACLESYDVALGVCQAVSVTPIPPSQGAFVDGTNQSSNPACFKERPAVDVMMVLDKSGSMATLTPFKGVLQPRITALQSAVSDLTLAWGDLMTTESANPRADNIGLVFFDSTTSNLVPLGLVTANFSTITGKFPITPSGSTSIGAGLSVAGSQIASNSGDGNRKVILLMSDGQQNTNPLVGPLAKIYCDPGSAPCSLAPSCLVGSQCDFLPNPTPQIYAVTLGPDNLGAINSQIASATHGFYLNTETDSGLLRPFFLELLQNFVKFNSYDTVRLISETAPYTVSIPISTTSYDVEFSLMWPGQLGAMRLTLISSGGAALIVKESESGFISIVEKLPLAVPYDPLKDWKVQVEGVSVSGHGSGALSVRGSTATSAGGIPFDLHVMTDDGGVKSDLSIVAGDYKPGDKIKLRAKLTQFGRPILGLGSHPGDKIVAELVKPGKSIGDILSDSNASADPSGPDVQTPAEAKLDNTLKANPSALIHKTDTIKLFDDGKPEHGDDVAGDGIYSALYLADLPGHYNFLIAAEAVDPKAVRFSRQQLRTAYVRPFPDGGNTDFQTSIVSKGTMQVIMTPRCKARDHMGPGWANYFWFTAPGVTPFKAKDNLNGTYTATLNFTGSKPPQVSVHFENVIALIGDSVTPNHLPQPLDSNNVLAPVPPPAGKLALFVDLGAGIPNGSFGSAFNTGLSFNAGLEYVFNPHVSAEGIFGYHHFGGKLTGGLNVFQFTGGGKVYSSPFNNNFVFARAGLGGYHFSFSPGSTTNFGGYFGGGLLHQFGKWGLEGAYTFHAVNTPGVATKFSTVQGGIRWVF
jgi:hypothetical protein